MITVEGQLAQLAARFDARAPAERAALEKALLDDDHQTLASQAHKLAGIAGIFGRDEIGIAAFALEEAIEAGGDILSAAALLDALLEKLAD